jgi:acyl carrier protein/nodulation protein F
MSDIASDVFDIIARCGRVERAAVLPDASLADLKIESLSVVEIIFALEEKFGIEIPFEANQQVVKFETVADVVKAVEGLVAAKRASA